LAFATTGIPISVATAYDPICCQAAVAQRVKMGMAHTAGCILARASPTAGYNDRIRLTFGRACLNEKQVLLRSYFLPGTQVRNGGRISSTTASRDPVIVSSMLSDQKVPLFRACFILINPHFTYFFRGFAVIECCAARGTEAQFA
jgi:hypothetical protein